VAASLASLPRWLSTSPSSSQPSWLEALMALCEPYFASGGCIVDQPFQQRLPEGMIRCYMGVDKVVGFGHQLIKALIPPPPEGSDSPAAQPGPRIMQRADAAPFQAPRQDGKRVWRGSASMRRRCPSSGMLIFSMDHTLLPDRTPTSCAKSTSVRFLRFPIRHLPQSRLTMERLESKAGSPARSRSESCSHSTTR
jgi:hypothetical protein